MANPLLPLRIDDRDLKRILETRPEITSVEYVPDSIQKRALSARCDPHIVRPVTGPEAPILTVTLHENKFRIDYHDPNEEFHCGWHVDDDHPEYGPIHFQQRVESADEHTYESANIDARTAPTILLVVVQRLFETVLPETIGD